MMKKSISAPSRQALSPLQSAGASSRVAQTNGSLMSSQMPQAEYPTEIGDAFEMMRQKYGQVSDGPVGIGGTAICGSKYTFEHSPLTPPRPNAPPN